MGYDFNLGEENDDIAIRLEGVTVRYRIFDEKIGGIKEYLDKLFTHKLHHKEFLALNNLNLTIKKGERIGIIGHNGAGKSTLLKVIAHVMKPTEGKITVDGSIAPLLELGAGFDLELSGEENIYLNGSILGKSKRYLDTVKEDIIDFAELGDFMYCAVKNYSSGMRAKLGFAIATQVDSDILLVDEVFGVGDENFKRKSKAKMIKMINSGKTVIIVSHDMTQIVDLTDRVIWMDNGEIIDDGKPEEICSKYCAYMLEHQNTVVKTRIAKAVKQKVKKENKSERKEDKEQSSKINKWAKKTGVLDKILNDSLLRTEIIQDKRILRELKNNEMLVERILKTDRALEMIAENEGLLDELFRHESVKAKLEDELYLVLEPEKVIGKINGLIENCIYYKESGVLYIKGCYMPVEVYSDIKIYMRGEHLGDAQLHLVRNDTIQNSSNMASEFSGWEFIKKIASSGDTIEILVFYKDNQIAKETVEVAVVDAELPESVAWKYEHSFSQAQCWELYQNHVRKEFNFLSFEMYKRYNELMEKNEDVGWLYKKNYSDEKGENGVRFKTNELGLCGPSDMDAQNIVIGGGIGLSFSVDEDKAWFSDKVFEKNWLNLCFACEPEQWQRLIKKNLKSIDKKRRAIVLYEAAFWSIGISKELIVEKETLGIEEIYAREKESFYRFYNKMYEGVFRIVQADGKKLLNCCYAQFDFEKNAKKCSNVIYKWFSILEKFDEVVVLRIPNKEYIYGAENHDDIFGELKQNHDEGWKLFKTGLEKLKNIKFMEPDDFSLSDYICTSSYLNEMGNEKLRKWILQA